MVRFFGKAILRIIVLISQLGILAVGGLGLLVLVISHWPMRISPLFDLNFVLVPWVLMALLPAMLMAFLLRRRHLRWLLLSLTLVLGAPYARFFLPHALPISPTGYPLRVMTFNTWGVKRPNDVEQIATLIYFQHPDVLLLQEVSAARLDRLMNRLNALYPNQKLNVAVNAETDQVTISRFPLTITGIDSSATQLLQTQVQTPAGPIEVWNVHAYRENFLAAFSERNVLSYSTLADHRDGIEQFQWLNRRIGQMPMQQPLIVAGDFNVTPFSPEYTLMTAHTKDAFAEVGWGFGFTFPATRGQMLTGTLRGRKIRVSSPGPVAQLDHVFHSGRVLAINTYVVLTSAGSDHRPVVSDFVLN